MVEFTVNMIMINTDNHYTLYNAFGLSLIAHPLLPPPPTAARDFSLAGGGCAPPSPLCPPPARAHPS